MIYSDANVSTEKAVIVTGSSSLRYERVVAVAWYLVFVWIIAYVRKDYLWIVGDDPNLLQQTLLIGRGLVPNVDYLSGYPGLSLQLNALIVHFVGAAPVSQHIYTAVQATVLGLVVFWATKNIRPLLVLIPLVFIYTQSFLLNPTPNPGYLFTAFFIAGMKKVFDYFDRKKLFDVAMSGAFFSASFLAKQYGVFGPVFFFIVAFAYLGAPRLIKNILFGVLLGVVCAGVAGPYFVNLIPESAQHDLLLRNSIVFLLPAIFSYLVFCVINYGEGFSKITIKEFVVANAVFGLTFLVVTLVYFVVAYGFSNVANVFNEVMVNVPRRINGYVVAVGFSRDALVRSAYGIGAVLILLIASRIKLFKGAYFLSAILVYLCGVLIPEDGNLSATPFLTIFWFFLLLNILLLSRNFQHKSAVVILAGLAPLFIILTPYPNYAYHLPILIFVMVYFLFDKRIADSNKLRRLHFFISLVSLVIASLLMLKIVVSESRRIGSMATYSYGDLKFKSGDRRWAEAILEAQGVTHGELSCATYGCRYLVLYQKDFVDYARIVEKPTYK